MRTIASFCAFVLVALTGLFATANAAEENPQITGPNVIGYLFAQGYARVVNVADPNTFYEGMEPAPEIPGASCMQGFVRKADDLRMLGWGSEAEIEIPAAFAEKGLYFICRPKSSQMPPKEGQSWPYFYGGLVAYGFTESTVEKYIEPKK